MQANTLNIFFGICGLALIVWGVSTSARLKMQEDMLTHTLSSIDNKIQTQNHLIAGKASYMPGAACIIRASVEQTPEDILSFASACATTHREWLIQQEISEMESESR